VTTEPRGRRVPSQTRSQTLRSQTLLCRALLWLAARRWPAELRSDLTAEWAAEVHMLAAERQRLAAVRFAASLALSRGPRAVPPPLFELGSSVLQRFMHALFLVLAPALTVLVAIFLPPLTALLGGGLIAFFAIFVGAASPLRRAGALAVAALTPAAAAIWAAPLVLPMLSAAWREPTSFVAWLGGLGATLLVAGRLRTVWAVPVGAVGALAACWLATTIAISLHAEALRLPSAGALRWYPQSLLYPVDLGLGTRVSEVTCLPGEDWCPGPVPLAWPVQDFTEGYPSALTLVAACVLAYVLAATRELRVPAGVQRPRTDLRPLVRP
jgi:hypothetical protein